MNLAKSSRDYIVEDEESQVYEHYLLDQDENQNFLEENGKNFTGLYFSEKCIFFKQTHV